MTGLICQIITERLEATALISGGKWNVKVEIIPKNMQAAIYSIPDDSFGSKLQ